MAVADAKMPHPASPVAPYVTVSVGVGLHPRRRDAADIAGRRRRPRDIRREAGRAQPGARGARRPADVGGAQPGRPARSRGAAAMSSGKNASNAASISASFARSTGEGDQAFAVARQARGDAAHRVVDVVAFAVGTGASRALPSAARSRAGAASASWRSRSTQFYTRAVKASSDPPSQRRQSRASRWSKCTSRHDPGGSGAARSANSARAARPGARRCNGRCAGARRFRRAPRRASRAARPGRTRSRRAARRGWPRPRAAPATRARR